MAPHPFHSLFAICALLALFGSSSPFTLIAMLLRLWSIRPEEADCRYPCRKYKLHPMVTYRSYNVSKSISHGCLQSSLCLCGPLAKKKAHTVRRSGQGLCEFHVHTVDTGRVTPPHFTFLLGLRLIHTRVPVQRLSSAHSFFLWFSHCRSLVMYFLTGLIHN